MDMLHLFLWCLIVTLSALGLGIKVRAMLVQMGVQPLPAQAQEDDMRNISSKGNGPVTDDTAEMCYHVLPCATHNRTLLVRFY